MTAVDKLRALARTRFRTCIPWRGAIQSGGYGCLKVDGRVMLAHRTMCEIAHGPALPGEEAAHTCGNRLCVNPAHVRWTDRRTNERDKAVQGSRRGPLDPSIVAMIRERPAATPLALSRALGCDPRSVARLRMREAA